MSIDEVITYLENKEEMIPDKHDGCYELVREAVKAYKDEDLSDTDYNDWNLIYFMAVGTWKNKVEIKHKFIDNAHLPEQKKQYLHSVLEKINDNAINRVYENREKDMPSIGLFGTGFQSFKIHKNNGQHDDFVRFIKMCFNLLIEDLDDEAYFDIADKPLSEPIKGVQAGAASMILHCLRPNTFPIINRQQGRKNIFLRLGLKLKSKGNLTTYISNCHLIKKFRDENYSFKNYRIFDCANFEMNKDDDVKEAALALVVKNYKKDFGEIDLHEHYKWKAIAQFHKEWDLQAEDFPGMVRRSLTKAGSLLKLRTGLTVDMIIDMAGRQPEVVRHMFEQLFDESILIQERIIDFIDSAKEITNFDNAFNIQNIYQIDNAIFTLLFLRYPQTYGIYKYAKLKNAAVNLKYEVSPDSDEDYIGVYNSILEWILEYINKDKVLIEMHRDRMEADDYQDENNHVLAEDILLYASLQGEKSDDIVSDIRKIGRNILLCGVPGVGKSYSIRKDYCDNPQYMERVVFHPDYTHSDFVGQIMPRVRDESLEYVFVPGPFTNCLKKAVNDKNNHYYLVVEELNRGNAQAIFGEIFQLLDRKEDTKIYKADEVGESEYSIYERDIAEVVYGDSEHEISIPSNMTILATMNTADQNVFTLDTAFQRRWEVKLIKNDVFSAKHADDRIDGDEVTWGAFASVINEKILEVCGGMLGSEDKRLGAYFIKRRELARKPFSEKVLKYLWDDVFRMERYSVFNTDILSVDDLFKCYLKTSVNPLSAVFKADIYKEMTEFDPENSASGNE